MLRKFFWSHNWPILAQIEPQNGFLSIISTSAYSICLILYILITFENIKLLLGVVRSYHHCKPWIKGRLCPNGALKLFFGYYNFDLIIIKVISHDENQFKCFQDIF